jgi:hypothetical protein
LTSKKILHKDFEIKWSIIIENQETINNIL